MARETDNQKLLIAFVVGMVLIVLTMIVAIFVMTRQPVVIVVPSDERAPAAAGEPLPPPAGVVTEPAVEVPPEIEVIRTTNAPSLDDPLDPFWDQIAPVELKLDPQQIAPPILATSTIPTVRVQAVRDDQRYVWRVSWDQPEPAHASDINLFTDAVALQFPLADGAPYTMGGPDAPVTMLYWKAIWQRDVDEGFQDTAVTHPEAYADFYWFAEGERPYTADEAFTSAIAQQYLVPAAAGNPMAEFNRTSPLEEITAHGFGSSTHVPDSNSDARGVWHDGEWIVLFDRAIDSGDPLIARFNERPEQQLISFAVFDGKAKNRGAQKHITNWIPMRIQP